MTNEIWLNLSVKNIQKSVDFFKSIGFGFNDERQSSSSACMLIGKHNFVVMLFQEEVFKTFTQTQLPDNQSCNQVLISIDAASKDEVDELEQKVKNAGGTIYATASESQGWLYGMGFSDLDGHKWNVLFMDYSKMPQ